MKSELNISELPIKLFTRPSKSPTGYSVAKAGLSLSRYDGTIDSIFGFSFGKDIEKAKSIAKFELLERLLARFEVQSQLTNGNFDYHKFDIFTHQKISEVAPGNIFVCPNPFSEMGCEATGLGLHNSLENAIEHGVLELLERHFCAEIWFDDNVRIKKIFKSIKISNDIKIDFFTLDEVNIPFVISCLYSTNDNVNNNFFILGHALCKTFDEAKMKSYHECLMLYDCHLSEDKTPSTNMMSKKRILSLNSESSTLRKTKFFKKINNNKTPINPHSHEFSEIIQALPHKRIYYVPLYVSEDLFLIRALSDDLLTLGECRLKNINLFLDDPYC